ncbi:unnamed protein product, partial [Effrenium voratum]
MKIYERLKKGEELRPFSDANVPIAEPALRPRPSEAPRPTPKARSVFTQLNLAKELPVERRLVPPVPPPPPPSAATSANRIRPPVPSEPPARREESKIEEAPPRLAGALWELPAEQVGLELLLSAQKSDWSYPIVDQSRRSFVGHLPQALPRDQSMRFFELIRRETRWHQPIGTTGQIPRKTA